MVCVKKKLLDHRIGKYIVQMLSNKKEKWILFLEDPGAVTYCYLLIEYFNLNGIEIIIISDGLAGGILDSKNINHLPFDKLYITAEYFRVNEINKLLVGTSENIESNGFLLIKIARKLTIPVVGLIDGAGSHKYRFKGKTDNSLFWAPDWIIVPDNLTHNLYVELGFPRHKIKIITHPHFIWIKKLSEEWTEVERQIHKKNLIPESKDRKVIVFVSEISDGLASWQYRRSNEYTLVGNSKHDGRTEIVLDEFLKVVNQITPRPYLVLRKHPKEKPEDLIEFFSSFDFVSYTENAIELINSADIVVGMTSSLLSEAYYLGKNVLSIVPISNEKIYLGDLADIIPSLYNSQQIESGIVKMLNGEFDIKKIPDNQILESSVVELFLKLL